SEIIDAVTAATPSLPLGSEAEPMLNSRRKLTRGEEYGRSTEAMLEAAFPARARPTPGAATAKISVTATTASRILLTRILFLIVGENDRRSLRLDKILACHLLNVFRRNCRIQVIKFVQGLG